jgi:hypothetical protein
MQILWAFRFNPLRPTGMRYAYNASRAHNHAPVILLRKITDFAAATAYRRLLRFSAYGRNSAPLPQNIAATHTALFLYAARRPENKQQKKRACEMYEVQFSITLLYALPAQSAAQ